MSETPKSELTLERPRIWAEGLALATSITGSDYRPKVPLPDGTIYACGGKGDHLRVPTRWQEIRRVIRIHKENLENLDPDDTAQIEKVKGWISQKEKELSELEKEAEGGQGASAIYVPDGAMEWLLHEVGHWVAATPVERARPNYGLSASEYGHDGDREWQAWAFEEIVMAPWGHARQFAPPTQRDGAAFSKNGPMPERHLRHADRRIEALDLDISEFRYVWGQWVNWGKSKRTLPWGKA